MNNERLKLEMTGIQMIQAMTGGNPGAVSVICKILKDGAKIDSDDAFKGFGTIMSMDTYGIYNEKIWMLYKDMCGENIIITMGMIRAAQLGIISDRVLMNAIMNRGAGIDIEATMKSVKEILPNFGEMIEEDSPIAKLQQMMEKHNSNKQELIDDADNVIEHTIDIEIEKTTVSE